VRHLPPRPDPPEAPETTRIEEREMMTSPFQYQAPTPEQVRTMEILAGDCEVVYQGLLLSAPPSAERTLAIRKLQECRMWANAAILGITIQ
jgi:hypothetical protein